MSLRHHEIAEATHRILDPLTETDLRLIGQVCRVGPHTRVLDLACGKGELLCEWAAWFGATGVGVDLSHVFLAAARERAAELGVRDHVAFVQGDAAAFHAEPAAFDIASCLGATWIGGGLAGTIALLRPAAKPGGLVIVGEPFWNEPPPAAALAALGVGPDDHTSLEGTLDRIEGAGMELVELVPARLEGWDRYEAPRWWAIDAWLRANPDDPDHAAMREFLDRNRRAHLAFGRRYLGWGVFVMRER